MIALGGAAPIDVGSLGSAKVVTIAAHDGPLVTAAAVVLPATSWAAQSGTFVNAKGIKQVSDQAIEPLGQSKPAWLQVSGVAAVLGYDASWTKLKQIRSNLSSPLPAMGSMGQTGQVHAE